MATITTRAGKGAPLTNAELDANFSNVNGEIVAHGADTSNPHAVTKAQVGLGNVTNDAQLKAASNLADVPNAATARANLGLGNVDNTSDAAKPVSTAQQTALDAKQDTLVSGTNIKTIGGQSLLGSGDIGQMAGFRNRLINGDFNIWQEATSQTASGYGSSDQWAHDHSGSTKTHSRQTFALGQTDVPGNPKYFARTVVSSVAGASNYCSQRQPIEGVSTFSGETATLSFWARADASKNMAIELEQHFGTGGSPSTIVLGIGSQLVALTTSWQKFEITVAIPSVAGKTLGSDGNDHLNVRFWFDAGSDYNARAASLGQQSGTFDVDRVQLEAGSVATPFEVRPYATELALCQRYWQTGGVRMLCYQLAGSGFGIHQPFPVQMRAAPTVAFQNIVYLNASALAVDVSQTHGFSSSAVATAAGAARYIADFTANARLP